MMGDNCVISENVLSVACRLNGHRQPDFSVGIPDWLLEIKLHIFGDFFS